MSDTTFSPFITISSTSFSPIVTYNAMSLTVEKMRACQCDTFGYDQADGRCQERPHVRMHQLVPVLRHKAPSRMQYVSFSQNSIK